MKVYVIERGCYSDRHVVGVTETKEDAKAVLKAMGNTEDVTYTEFDTKQFQTQMLRFVVDFSEEKTSCWFCYCEDSFYSEVKETCEYYDDYYIIYAKTREQAIKIARDMRAEKKAKENKLTF